MRIDAELCTGCEVCLPLCPMKAISMRDNKAVIDEDECVDCNTCLMSEVCPVDALVFETASWPRLLRAAFSNPLADRKAMGLPGRGTEKLMTVEITEHLKSDTLVVGIELGRPITGTRLHDVEKVAQALAKLGVKFEPDNLVTFLMQDTNTGKLRLDVLNEKVLSAIIECNFPKEKCPKLLKTLQEVTCEINTVCSVEVADTVDPSDQVSIEKTLSDLDVIYCVNGKTNIGLGRPGGR